MHDSVRSFVEAQVRERAIGRGRTLDVGSYDVNGSAHEFFTGDYIGLDMRAGPGVDVIGSAASLPFADDAFDVVVSTEMLEHDTRPWESIAEMRRVLRPDGYLLLTARGYDERGCFAVHGYPFDHWRFSVGAIRALLESAHLDPIIVAPDPEFPGVFATARR